MCTVSDFGFHERGFHPGVPTYVPAGDLKRVPEGGFVKRPELEFDVTPLRSGESLHRPDATLPGAHGP